MQINITVSESGQQHELTQLVASHLRGTITAIEEGELTPTEAISALEFLAQMLETGYVFDHAPPVKSPPKYLQAISQITRLKNSL